jgi:hypothetical protein
MDNLYGAAVIRRFVPLIPCPEGRPGHFHFATAALQEQYGSWIGQDVFGDPLTGSIWLLAAKPQEAKV